MIPWTKLDAARAPDGTELSLWQRGAELVVRAGGVDLMSTRAHASEERLAELGCEILAERASVLIGGLGMGFTALSQSQNRWLYGHEGLAAAARAIRPGGRLAVWSAGDDQAFTRRMGRAGFRARALPARAHGASGQGRCARHVIFIGDRAR